jgi:hypothetical protein
MLSGLAEICKPSQPTPYSVDPPLLDRSKVSPTRLPMTQTGFVLTTACLVRQLASVDTHAPGQAVRVFRHWFRLPAIITAFFIFAILCPSDSFSSTLVRKSVFYLPLDRRTRRQGPPLLEANSSSIRTYGIRRLSLHFPSNTYQWDFIVADVNRPLLGAELFRSNFLLVDFKGKRLVDALAFHSTPLTLSTAPATHLGAISDTTSQYDTLLAEFPAITTLNFVQSLTKHGVQHFSITSGPPVYSRPRRYPPQTNWQPLN